MSVCVSVNPVCATNKELNLTVLANEHLYFDFELFESDLPIQFLSYLDKSYVSRQIIMII